MNRTRRSPPATQARDQLLPPVRKRRGCTDNLWLLATPREGGVVVAHSDPMMELFYYIGGWHSVQDIHYGPLASQVPCVQGPVQGANVSYAAGVSLADLNLHVMRIENWRRVIPCIRRIRPHLTGALERHLFEAVHELPVSIAELLARRSEVSASLMLGCLGLLLRRRTIQSDLDERPWSLRTRLWRAP